MDDNHDKFQAYERTVHKIRQICDEVPHWIEVTSSTIEVIADILADTLNRRGRDELQLTVRVVSLEDLDSVIPGVANLNETGFWSSACLEMRSILRFAIRISDIKRLLASALQEISDRKNEVFIVNQAQLDNLQLTAAEFARLSAAECNAKLENVEAFLRSAQYSIGQIRRYNQTLRALPELLNEMKASNLAAEAFIPAMEMRPNGDFLREILEERLNLIRDEQQPSDDDKKALMDVASYPYIFEHFDMFVELCHQLQRVTEEVLGAHQNADGETGGEDQEGDEEGDEIEEESENGEHGDGQIKDEHRDDEGERLQAEEAYEDWLPQFENEPPQFRDEIFQFEDAPPDFEGRLAQFGGMPQRMPYHGIHINAYQGFRQDFGQDFGQGFGQDLGGDIDQNFGQEDFMGGDGVFGIRTAARRR